jgi:hypothetical protein
MINCGQVEDTRPHFSGAKLRLMLQSHIASQVIDDLCVNLAS